MAHSPAASTWAAPPLSRIADWALPVAFALVFLNVAFQPTVAHGGVTVAPSDLAVLAAVVFAAVAARRSWRTLARSSVALWASAAVFLAYAAAASVYPLAYDAQLHWRTHLVTAAKYGEYALLAPAVAMLAHDQVAIRRLWASVAGVAAAAALVALIQFCGAGIFDPWPPSRLREPSFTGIAELATLGGAGLSIGFVAILWPGTVSRATAIAATAGGAVDEICSGALAGIIGLAAVALVAAVVISRRTKVSPRRFAAVAAITLVCAGGVLELRSGDLNQFARYIGLEHANHDTHADVNTYAQRSLMYYIGFKVFEAHPATGAGWQAIRETQVYSPFLADAHRRFPGQPAQAFPSPKHPWGIDDAYIQVLAELGLLGAITFAAWLFYALRAGSVGALRAPTEQSLWALVGLLWLLTTMGMWTGQGLVAGSAFAALSWFGVGLIAAQRFAR